MEVMLQLNLVISKSQFDKKYSSLKHQGFETTRLTKIYFTVKIHEKILRFDVSLDVIFKMNLLDE